MERDCYKENRHAAQAKLQQSYLLNYAKIYFWQAFSLILGLLSLFGVMPIISQNKETFGVYSVCVSFAIFLSYVDFGFVSAAQKYAAEYFARSELDRELETIGLIVFILTIFATITSGVFVCFGLRPNLIVKTASEANYVIASKLFFILAGFTFTIIPQRVCQIIFGARVEDYIHHRITTAFNLLRIASIYFFTRDSSVNLVAYFLFQQIIGMSAALTSVIVGLKRYHINLFALLKNVRLNLPVLRSNRKLALNSLVLTISWIVFYELDTIVIGKLFGATDVAYFSVGLTLLSFIRSILGIVFSPFAARFNHYIGLGDRKGLETLLRQLLKYSFPVIVFPLLSLASVARPFVFAWVGEQYEPSVTIIRWLILCNIFAFAAYPTSLLLTALEKVGYLYPVSLIMPLVYWSGSLLFYQKWGIQTFAIAKFISFLINGIFLLLFVLKHLKITPSGVWKWFYAPVLPGFSLIMLYANFSNAILPASKGTMSLAIVGSVTLIISAACAAIYFFFALRREVSSWVFKKSL